MKLGVIRENLIETALGLRKADLVIKNAQILNVFTGEILPGNIAITDGVIAAVGNTGDYSSAELSERTEDAKGQFIVPGFINAHCHVESSMMTPALYCREELRWGVTSVITDPHETANVAGLDGIRFMRDSVKNVPIDYYIQIPSCVPATSFENNGATIDAGDIAELIGETKITGIAEMMNYPGVLLRDKHVMEILETAESMQNKVIDGHAPSLSGKDLQAYIAAGIRTDHESTHFQEALEKLRSGMAVLVREGSTSKNLREIISGVVKHGISTDFMAFCTDDKNISDIRQEGTIRQCIRESIALGLAPVEAYRMASINAARIYNLKNAGAVAPGYQADLVMLSDLEDVAVTRVYKRGIAVTADSFPPIKAVTIPNSVRIAPVSEESFALPTPANGKYPVIRVVPNQIITDKDFADSENAIQMLGSGQLCKVAVIERHRAKGNVGVGLLAGYGLKRGAIASTVCHDSHNIIVAGVNDRDMLLAVREIERISGGYVLVCDGEVLGKLPLPVYGLMSNCEPDEFIKALDELRQKSHETGISINIEPFGALSFLALPVIPKIRITDMGVFDVEKFEFISSL